MGLLSISSSPERVLDEDSMEVEEKNGVGETEVVRKFSLLSSVTRLEFWSAFLALAGLQLIFFILGVLLQ